MCPATHRQSLGGATAGFGHLALVGVGTQDGGIAAEVIVGGVKGVEAAGGQAVGQVSESSSGGAVRQGGGGGSGGGDVVLVCIWSRVWSPPEFCCKEITTIIISIVPRPGCVLPEHPDCRPDC